MFVALFNASWCTSKYINKGLIKFEFTRIKKFPFRTRFTSFLIISIQFYLILSDFLKNIQ